MILIVNEDIFYSDLFTFIFNLFFFQVGKTVQFKIKIRGAMGISKRYKSVSMNCNC